ncbi:leucyl aminopeptidase [Nannocystis pusilla]|uniref:Probable cytosol aminopeptidase n=1 Tax=Nannocystis pusilla TaxID=889268 RepID=A0ABS7U4W4_9BACT|nr:leucyl aminopeptidase [Nannocystis pusilla]MBZ5715489.1 leucyl aminopeptidase [Nannocystis pusilla]
MLSIEWTSQEVVGAGHHLLAVAVASGDVGPAIERRFGGGLARAAQAARFRGEPGEKFTFLREHQGEPQQVLLLGTGASAPNAAGVRALAFDAVRAGATAGVTDVVLDLRGLGASSEPVHFGDLVAQGLQLGTYRYDRYLSEAKRKPATVKRVRVLGDVAAGEGTARGQIVAASVARARDLVNGPANLVTPSYLADVAQEIADALADRGVKLSVLEREECEKLGMGCYLAVARGSAQRPKFIHLQYTPKGASRGRVCLVGKGVTFDSGGLSLKPSDAMMDMKMDMGGAAAVLSALEGAARLGVPWEVHAIVAATENMIGGDAYRLGDVLTASNGKTVEIDNTDAEGRLTLADALVYAGKLAPTYLFDFATLTGACIVALGPRCAGVMSRDDELANQFTAASERVGEEMWRLPLPEPLKEQLKSSIADMRNTGERYGGAITAGLFLSEFTAGQRWVHVDIAGPAMVRKPFGVCDEGGSGFPVATILEFLGRA